jgi:hypothetical protein
VSTQTFNQSFGTDLCRLGITYNAFGLQEARDMFESWAAAEYPLLWDQLMKKGKKSRVVEESTTLDSEVTDLRIERHLRA